MSIIDSPKPVRDGEQFDLAAAAQYIKSKMPDIEGEAELLQFPSGFSNLTYMIRIGESELVLRRPPFGRKAKSAHDMGREYRMLSSLRPHFPYCPEVHFLCEDESVIGAQFYVMQKMTGIIPRKKFPRGVDIGPAEAKKLCENLVDVFTRLHGVDYIEAGLGDFGKPEGYVRRQVDGWSGRYRSARTDDAPDFEEVMSWLDQKAQPDNPRPSVIHNDYKFDNVLLDPERPTEIIGVLDWELATIGDPLMDLGSSLAYWVDRDDPPQMQAMRLLPTTDEGMATRAEIVRMYEEKSGIKIDNFDFYFCFGLFRLAVIAQQIYYRFYHGQTKDERFKMLIFAVHGLQDTAKALVNSSEL